MLSLLTNLCAEKNIRSCAIEQTDLLQVLLKDFECDESERQLNLLGLLINLTNEKCVALERISQQVIPHSQILDK